MISLEGVAPSVGVCGTERRSMVWVGCGLSGHIDEAAQQEEGSVARRPRNKKKGRR